MRTSRTSKATVILLAAIVVLLIRGTRQQRAIRKALFTFTLGSWISDRADNIFGFFGSIGGAVKDFVIAVVQQVVDWAQSAFDTLWSWVHDVEQLAWAVYDAAIKFADGVYDRATAFASWVAAAARQYASDLANWAIAVAHTLFDQATAFASWIVAEVRQYASDLANWAIGVAQALFDAAMAFAHGIYDALTSLIGWVWTQAQGLVHSAVDALLSVVRAMVDAAIGFAQHAIAAAVSALRSVLDAAVAGLRTLIDAASGALRSLIDGLLAPVTDYLFGTVRAIIDVILTVLDWLLALAEFPFTTARDLWAAMRQTGGENVRDWAGGFGDRHGLAVLGYTRNWAQSRDRSYQLPPMPDRPSAGGGMSTGGGSSSSGAGTPDRLAFTHALLAQLGAAQNDSTVGFVLAWMAREGTSATFNPLATTLDYGTNTRFNSTGVRNYADFDTGVAATARTLTGGGYDRIVTDLQRGDGRAAGQEHDELARWSGGGYDTIAA